MPIVAFLVRGLAWGIGGLALISLEPLNTWQSVFLALAWLAGLAMIAVLTRKGEIAGQFGWAVTWASMFTAYLAIAAILWGFRA